MDILARVTALLRERTLLFVFRPVGKNWVFLIISRLYNFFCMSIYLHAYYYYITFGVLAITPDDWIESGRSDNQQTSRYEISPLITCMFRIIKIISQIVGIKFPGVKMGTLIGKIIRERRCCWASSIMPRLSDIICGIAFQGAPQRGRLLFRRPIRKSPFSRVSAAGARETVPRSRPQVSVDGKFVGPVLH